MRMIYLLRHGEILTGPGKRFIGQTDCGLSARGRRQALAWKPFFTGCTLSHIFCSDLCRSQQTAELIAGARADRLRIEPRLREISLGDWENQAMDAVRAAHPQAWAQRGRDLAGYRPPGGESFRDLSRRVLSFFDDLQTGLQADMLLVGHAGVNRVLLCSLLGMPLNNLFRLGQEYACLNCIQVRGAAYQIQGLNMPVNEAAW
ncbi:MAG: histidine phosphatase family protein [Desulfohalobiaceae bacterium]|nr:histidine phosphatase family protein [Desulfohalobiaceae bacterium]